MQALIDGPARITGVSRQLINFKWLQLTDLKACGKKQDADGKWKTVGIARNARQASLAKAWEELDILNRWKKSSWGKRVAAKVAKAASTDLGRFEARRAKQVKAKAIAAKL